MLLEILYCYSLFFLYLACLLPEVAGEFPPYQFKLFFPFFATLEVPKLHTMVEYIWHWDSQARGAKKIDGDDIWGKHSIYVLTRGHLSWPCRDPCSRRVFSFALLSKNNKCFVSLGLNQRIHKWLYVVHTHWCCNNNIYIFAGSPSSKVADDRPRRFCRRASVALKLFIPTVPIIIMIATLVQKSLICE